MITETKTERIEPDITVVAILGKLNLGNSLMTVENSIRRLVEEGARKLVIDLAGLSAIDSSGIGMMVSCCGHIENRGGRMRVAGAHGAVLKSLELVHLGRLTPLDSDVDTACLHLRTGAARA